jgi:CBS-domain-containing membrane protein
VYDLVGGRAAWTVLGWPTEGVVGDRGRIAKFVRSVPGVTLDATIAEVRPFVDGQLPIPVLDDARVLLGAVAATAAQLPPDSRVADIMVSAPGTIRPDLRIEEVARQLADDHLDHVFVTTAAGVLVGLVVTADLHA